MRASGSLLLPVLLAACSDGANPIAFDAAALDATVSSPPDAAPPVIHMEAVETTADPLAAIRAHLDRGLDMVGWKEEDLGFPADKIEPLYGHDPAELAFYDPVRMAPMSLAPIAQQTIDDLAAAARSTDHDVVTSAIVEAAARNDPAGLVRKTMTLSFALDPEAPLLAAFRQVFAFTNPWPSAPTSPRFEERETALAAQIAKLAPPVQQALARLLLAMLEAQALRDAAMPKNMSFADLEALHAALLGAPPDGFFQRFHDDYPAAMDLGIDQLAFAAEVVAAEAERVGAMLASDPLPADLIIEEATPLGKIVLVGGSDAQTYADPDLALVVDQGGDDTYSDTGGATLVPYVATSVVVDVAGNDTYVSTSPLGNTFAHGSGLLGVGIVLDLAGNDTYDDVSYAEGLGYFGVGVLYDAGGDDTYSLHSDGQGAAAYGIGLLIDGGGNDAYATWIIGQGYGWVRGIGALVDVDGDDSYFAAPSEPLVAPAPQTNNRYNMSMAQGFGMGYRPGADGDLDVSGGLGALIDLGAGKDTATAGLYAQGSAYWKAIGIFYDEGGDDARSAAHYAQGGPVHRAFAYFRDRGGDDVYDMGLALGMGCAHDLTVAFFIDDAGNDEYMAPPTDPLDPEQYSLSLGVGNDEGFGFFIDGAGDDKYVVPLAKAVTLGGTRLTGLRMGAREGLRNLGFFLDAGGDDVYDYEDVAADIHPANGTVWLAPPWVPDLADPALDKGIGMDVQASP